MYNFFKIHLIGFLAVVAFMFPECKSDVIRRQAINDGQKKIVCYYTNWSAYRPGPAKFTPENIDPNLCTHLVYAYAELDDVKNTLQSLDRNQDIDQSGYKKFTGLKRKNPNLKTLIGVGGIKAGPAKFSKLASSKESRAAFVKNVIAFLHEYNFDGLDLVWKYPSSTGGRPEDRNNYVSLVRELREGFDKDSSETGIPRFLLTIGVPHQVEHIDKGFDLPNLSSYVDIMNVLTYEYHTASEPKTSHHAPLYALREGSEDNADYTINYYLKKGAEPKKLTVSIPTYGRSYTLSNPGSTDIGAPASSAGEEGSATKQKGALAYFEICEKVNKYSWAVVQPKKGSSGPYAFRGNQWVDYDDVDIVREKAKYVNEKGLGGVMFWTIDFDDFRGECHGKPYPIIEAAKEALSSDNNLKRAK